MSAPKGGFDGDLDAKSSHVASVAVLIGVVAAVVATATIWLILTDPVTVATAVETGEVSPLVRQLADVIYSAISRLLDFL
ncbi:MAG: hypothetical protein JF610_17160 [Acidobacteria bacterium]|nr:hypothetical protein [Acidobacteriota bacterium]